MAGRDTVDLSFYRAGIGVDIDAGGVKSGVIVEELDGNRPAGAQVIAEIGTRTASISE